MSSALAEISKCTAQIKRKYLLGFDPEQAKAEEERIVKEMMIDKEMRLVWSIIFITTFIYKTNIKHWI